MAAGAMDKKYVSKMLTDRIEELRDRYYMYCNGINETGREISPASAASARSKAKKDWDICLFVEFLLNHIQGDFYLTEDAEIGFTRLCEPYEQHRAAWKGEFR